jgi:ABC-type phosphate transport system substrate-binding protein
MKDLLARRWIHTAVVVCLLFGSSAPLFPAIKNWAVVTATGSKLQDVPLGEVSKMCKGTQKAWPDGRPFTLVIHDPESPEMRFAVQKLFGVDGSELKSLLAKLNEARTMIKVVESDEDVFRTVEATPGAIGLVDVYSINSSVKVLRIDGKLPFDAGYPLKGN